MPSPPRNWPKLRPIVSSSSSAILLFSRIAPIRTKTGIAISTVLVIRPKARCAIAPSKATFHHAQRPSEIGEDHRDPGDAERYRKAGQDGQHEGAEHDQVEILGHAFALSWNRRTKSDTDWSRMRIQKAGIRDLSKKTASIPPTEIGPSEDRPGVPDRGPRPSRAAPAIDGISRKTWPKMSMRRRAGIADLGIEHIHADMLVDEQRVSCPQHEERGVHVEHAFLRRDGVEAEDIAPR